VQDKIKHLLSDIQAGDQKALARGITILENELDGYEDILLLMHSKPEARIVGITGPPGAGKSTLVNALLHHWVGKGKKIAVVAVDPSSPFNLGAILGDRIRMNEFYNHPGVYIRSLASRGALGGLTPKILEITDLIKTAPFDLILVETVGVGQSEVEIAGLADCTVVALVPEAGDEVQTMKAGLMEIAQIFVVNKADRDMADLLYRSLCLLVHEKAQDGREIPVIKTVAIQNQGIEELTSAIEVFLAEHQNQSEWKLNLLVEKSWQLIQAQRMKDIDKKTLRVWLENDLKENKFNLYAFIREHS
jgi:LAO/AO transport system kinase